MTTFTILVTVEGTKAEAETLREEVVGAVEDTWERDRIHASVDAIYELSNTTSRPKP